MSHDQETPDLLKPGQLFAGRYKIVRFLAKGGMGAVFVGEHTATEQRVAIKVLWPNILASKSAVEKFELEARVAGRVRSDHIVQVIDAGFDEVTKMPFLVMELLEGKNLEQVVQQQGPLDSTTLVAYMAQVASGLDRAHRYSRDGVVMPIVHRDLKPENLFLARRDDGSALVKILDFGIAKVVSEGTKLSREIKGTPLFMAYEQAAGGKITGATDVWALGLIVFWLSTGRYYWKAAEDPEASITNLFAEVLSLELAPPSQRVRDYGQTPPWPPAFDAWFLRCIHRDPATRFPSAGEAIAALAEVLAVPLPSGIQPPTSLPQPQTIAAAPMPAAAVASSALNQSTQGLASTQPAVPPRSQRPAMAAGAAALLLLAAGGFLMLRRTAEPAMASAAVDLVAATASSAPAAVDPPPPPSAASAAPPVAPSAPPPVASAPPAGKPTTAPVSHPAAPVAGKPATKAGTNHKPNDKDAYGSR